MKINRILLSSLFAFALCAVTSAVSFAAETLQVVDAEIPMPPPGVPVMAGFAKIINTSAEEIIVVSARSDSFSKVEFHQTTVKDDVARMRKIKQLAIPADSMIKLEHGSYHLMMIDPVAGLDAGNTVEIELEIANSDRITVSFVLIEGRHTSSHTKSHDMKKMDNDIENADHKIKN